MGGRLGASRGSHRRTPELARAGPTPGAAAASWGRPVWQAAGFWHAFHQMVEDAPGEGNEMPRVRETTAARTAGGSAFADHLSAPRGRGALRDAPHSGAAGGAACGDLVRVAVRVVGERVAQAGFEASGCGAAQAAGSAVVELVEGAPLLEAARV